MNHNVVGGQLPAEIINVIPTPLPFPTPSSLTIHRRCTIFLSDPSQNARLTSFASAYDILALRPLSEKSLSQACLDLECDIISIDLTERYPFYFKHKMVANAVKRGIKFELCYAPGLLVNDGGQARRNLISNATGLIRATRGRGIIISSEAKRALALRGPSDAVNMACVWGLGQERGAEGIGREARSVVVQAGLKRTGYRGVIDVLYGGEQPEASYAQRKEAGKAQNAKGKRKAIVLGDEPEDESHPTPISKREQKRRQKKVRRDASNKTSEGKSVTTMEAQTTAST